MERDLSVIAEHWSDFARLRKISSHASYPPNYNFDRVLFPICNIEGSYKTLGELVNKCEPFYVYSFPIAIISPDGLNAYIYSIYSDNHEIIPISELKTSLCKMGINNENDRMFINGMPTESLRNALSMIRSRADLKPELEEIFDEYYEICMHHLHPTMTKSARN